MGADSAVAGDIDADESGKEELEDEIGVLSLGIAPAGSLMSVDAKLNGCCR